MTLTEIRRRFLDAFARRGHAVVASSPLIPQNDPTLFFVNAGMVQFKDVFTGQEHRDYTRAASAQRCLRVSGKHNDLEVVGRTARHHTLFEMLGNFSFGDYFKRDAIRFAWDVLTQEFGLDAERLWVTVFEEDDEAYLIWTEEVGVPASRVQRMDARDNFWSMGPVGPCGPCSEIHWDRGPEISGELGGPATGDDRYMEIWNLVFMQFEQLEDGTRHPLPRPSIDTGMGLERIATVLQGVATNWDTDAFQPIIAIASRLSGVPYGRNAETDVALRVIADHSRAAAFLVADGVTPSNEGRGYVLRRIMRRAVRFGVKLGLEAPFLVHTVACVVDLLGEPYPELRRRADFIREIVQTEELRFAETLQRGLGELERAFAELAPGAPVPGSVAFKLHDTFGFPLDLTRLIAEERGFGVDEGGFAAEMDQQRARGRAHWKGSGQEALEALDGAVLARLHGTEFVGYDALRGAAPILALLGGGGSVERAATGAVVEVAVPASPFYAESGGQVGDQGHIRTATGTVRVKDVVKGSGGVFLHRGEVVDGEVSVGQEASLEVDEPVRAATMANHTATHLLHAALRQVLGEHVAQQGSLVAPDRLRFDFSHHKAVTADEIAAIEELVYAEVLSNTELHVRSMPIDDARGLGAMALFGERYGDVVRVVEVPGFSIELCGGTHVGRTGHIGLFRITSEASVSAGVRRIEAVTGQGAFAFVRARERALAEATGLLRTTVAGLPEAIEKGQAERRRLEKELDQLRREVARLSAGDLLQQVRDVHGMKVLVAELAADAGTLRDEADRLRDQLGSGVVVLGSRVDGKVHVVATVSRDLAGTRAHAGNLVREVARQVGGGGGGRPDMAQAGGKDPDALPAALESVFSLLTNA